MREVRLKGYKSNSNVGYVLGLYEKSVLCLREFRTALRDLVTSICSSKTRRVQADLLGRQLGMNKRNVLGLIDAFSLKSIGVSDLEAWKIRFKLGEMDEIFSKWEEDSAQIDTHKR
jgi:hypothetical protein